MNTWLISSLLSGPITDPVAVFLTILAIMLVAPLLFERLQLPGIVGLILAGVIVGPYGLGLLERGSNIILLGTVGLLFLMFMAGLETSLDDLKDNGDKATIFGLATFVAPMIIGTGAMLLLGYSFLAAVLVASCFSSHTLLALPVLNKLGIMQTPAVKAALSRDTCKIVPHLPLILARHSFRTLLPSNLFHIPLQIFTCTTNINHCRI